MVEGGVYVSDETREKAKAIALMLYLRGQIAEGDIRIWESRATGHLACGRTFDFEKGAWCQKKQTGEVLPNK